MFVDERSSFAETPDFLHEMKANGLLGGGHLVSCLGFHFGRYEARREQGLRTALGGKGWRLSFPSSDGRPFSSFSLLSAAGCHCCFDGLEGSSWAWASSIFLALVLLL